MLNNALPGVWGGGLQGDCGAVLLLPLQLLAALPPPPALPAEEAGEQQEQKEEGKNNQQEEEDEHGTLLAEAHASDIVQELPKYRTHPFPCTVPASIESVLHYRSLN